MRSESWIRRLRVAILNSCNVEFVILFYRLSIENTVRRVSIKGGRPIQIPSEVRLFQRAAEDRLLRNQDIRPTNALGGAIRIKLFTNDGEETNLTLILSTKIGILSATHYNETRAQLPHAMKCYSETLQRLTLAPS